MSDSALDLVVSVDPDAITGGMTGINNQPTPIVSLPPHHLETVIGGAGAAPAPASSFTNAARGFAGGLACLGKFAVDGTPGTNTYDTYLACQRAAHQF